MVVSHEDTQMGSYVRSGGGNDNNHSMDILSGTSTDFFCEGSDFLSRCSSWVKVEVDLLGEFPNRINIGVRKQSGEVVEKWIRIKYDYVPKYCVTCRLQGHNEQECYALHPKLYPKKNEASMEKQENKGHKEMGQTIPEGGKAKAGEKGET
ncbi:hypothetical protein KY285_013289 [Solanum tuberosum]|nr:hypothetical protein KY285_013289 [Solanum tuberosum]